MLTLHEKPDAIEVATLYESEADKKGTPVFWFPRKDATLKLGVDDVENYFKTPEFRDEYKLSVAAARDIAEALLKGADVPENKNLNNKYFEVKKDLEKKLRVQTGSKEAPT